ncbi:hypothetical protein CLOM_g13044 [Closterium sp. NIES-68]|nr:hypothetical protein CLOM_g13044 [Closterium sp. NIES-68]GJP84482.1 hypothetical protein CLOP_g14549 [Closterium sp. NIES-67]
MAERRESGAVLPPAAEAESGGSQRAPADTRVLLEPSSRPSSLPLPPLAQPAETHGDSRAAADARRNFDTLASDLERAVRTTVTSESQLHDAIATCLFVANALCDWPDSDDRRAREEFGFRVLRSMPEEAESLLLRDRYFLMESSSSKRRAPSSPWKGFTGPQGSSRVYATVAVPPALIPLLPSQLHSPFRTQLDVTTCKIDQKHKRPQAAMLPLQHPSHEHTQQLHALKARRYFLLVDQPLSHRPPPPAPLPRSLSEAQSRSPTVPSGPQPHSPPPSSSPTPKAVSSQPTPRFWQPLSLVLISSTAPSHAVTLDAKQLYSTARAYLSGRARGDGSGDGSGDDDVQGVLRALQGCGVASAGELSGVVDEKGWTAMHIAARQGDTEVLQALLHMGMPAGVCSTLNATTPMHLAAYGGHVGSMELLAQHGADMRARTAGGWTPVHNAASQQQWGAVRWLAQQGVTPEELKTPGANPRPDKLPAHLMKTAVEKVKEEDDKRWVEEFLAESGISADVMAGCS